VLEGGWRYKGKKHQFDSFTTIKVMPIDENLRVSKDFFSVKITVRAKSGNHIKIQEKPLVTYPISKYDSFIEDLNKRNPTKFKKGGEVETQTIINENELLR
jgi:hypothetical protein